MYGAQFVHFHGWELPLRFEGIPAEHRHTRNCVSLFDCCHMGEIMRLLAELHAEGRTVLLVTHDPAVAELAEYTLHMRDGRLLP